jgi:hypothetical protein
MTTSDDITLCPRCQQGNMFPTPSRGYRICTNCKLSLSEQQYYSYYNWFIPPSPDPIVNPILFGVVLILLLAVYLATPTLLRMAIIVTGIWFTGTRMAPRFMYNVVYHRVSSRPWSSIPLRQAYLLHAWRRIGSAANMFALFVLPYVVFTVTQNALVALLTYVPFILQRYQEVQHMKKQKSNMPQTSNDKANRLRKSPAENTELLGITYGAAEIVVIMWVFVIG